MTPDVSIDIEGYKIHRKIGEGAMAGVFLADQISLGRPVALKVLAQELAGQRGFTERFLKEGRIIAFLKHPQIVNVYDLGSHHHHYYLAMELLSGGTLEEKIKDGLSPAQSVQLLKKISQALGFAHDNGVIHRDIKSQNIMFRSDGIPVLTDFGIARLMDNDPQLTIPGRTIGSPSYMSPEQICGHTIDPRADLYSVGILFYKMLTNTMPYQSDQILTVAMMHKTSPIPVLSEDLSIFQPVLNKLLAKDPDQRYPSAQGLIEALTQLESENPDLCLSAHQELDQTQHTNSVSAGGQKNISVTDELNPTAPVTQRALEPRYGEVDTGQGAHEEADTQAQSDENVQSLNNGAIEPPKRKFMGRIGFAMGGGLSVLAAGVLAFYFYFQQYVELPQSSSDSVPGATADTAWNHVPASHKTRIFHSIPPREAPPAGPSIKPDPDPSSTDQEIEALVVRAHGQLATYSLTSPAGDNCYETYQQILFLDPSGQRAESVLKEIGKAYHRLALSAQRKSDLHQSLTLVGKGLALRPKDSSLLALQDDLRMKLVEQTRIKQGQTKRMEQQEITRAAKLASMEQRLNAKIQLEARRRKEAEREPIEKPEDVPETAEPSKVKVNIEPTKSAAEPSDNRKRLFGTF